MAVGNAHCKEVHITCTTKILYHGGLGMITTEMENDGNMAIAYLVLCVNPSHSV